MDSATGFRLSFVKFEDGERYPLLTDEDGLPLIYPTLFATVRYRNNSQAPRTTRAALDAIRRSEFWARGAIGTFEERFRSGELLDEHEINALCDSLGHAEKIEIPAKTLRYTPERGPLRAAKRAPTVGKEEKSARISYVATYVEWLARRLLPNSLQRANEVERMVIALKAHRPSFNRKSRLDDRHAFSPTQTARIKSVAEPSTDNDDNPFTEPVRARNALIVRVLWEGLRVGELGALEVGDIDFKNNIIRVKRSHNRPNDPRANEPTAKTYDRQIPISDSLARALLAYVMNERRKFSQARKWNFLFVTAKNSGRTKAGSPMSISALRKVISVLSGALPDDIRVFPHRFRHDSATTVRDKLMSQGKTDSEIHNILCYLFGWSYTSDTSKTYTGKSLEKAAREAQQVIQASATPVKK